MDRNHLFQGFYCETLARRCLELMELQGYKTIFSPIRLSLFLFVFCLLNLKQYEVRFRNKFNKSVFKSCWDGNFLQRDCYLQFQGHMCKEQEYTLIRMIHSVFHPQCTHSLTCICWTEVRSFNDAASKNSSDNSFLKMNFMMIILLITVKTHKHPQ